MARPGFLTTYERRCNVYAYSFTAERPPFERSFHLPPFGGEDRGYNDEASVLVNVSADGVDLNVIWSEVAQALQAWNAERGGITSLLTYATTNTADAIPPSTGVESFRAR